MTKRTFILDPSLTFDPSATSAEQKTRKPGGDGCCTPESAAQPQAPGACCEPGAKPRAAEPRESGCC
ncbi:MAG: hypothetical protein ACRBN8_05365 [Nannocystales bacterium]